MKLKENEKIIKIIKPHYFTLLILWWFAWLSIIISGIVYFLLWDYLYKIIIFIGLLQISAIIFYYLFLSFELSIFVVTNTRVIYIKQMNIFQHNYEYWNFSQLQAVKVEQKGFFSNYFWYGTLIIQTNSWEKIFLKYIKETLLEAQDLIKIIKDNT